jgi:hypothetical protein
VQEVIARVWQKVLNVPKVGARDNFFALGGHSLLAVQAHRELRTELGTDRISITDIFRYPTLSALAQHLGGGAGGGAASTPAAATAPSAPGGAASGEAQAAQRAEAMARRRMMRAGRDG